MNPNAGSAPASAAKVRQALARVRAVLAEAGARPERLVRLTRYLTDRRE